MYDSCVMYRVSKLFTRLPSRPFLLFPSSRHFGKRERRLELDHDGVSRRGFVGAGRFCALDRAPDLLEVGAHTGVGKNPTKRRTKTNDGQVLRETN